MVVADSDKLSEAIDSWLLIIALSVVELLETKVGGFVATHTPKIILMRRTFTLGLTHK